MATEFTRTREGNVVIDGITIPMKIFTSLEPSYTEIEGLDNLHYKSGGPRRVVSNGKHYVIDGVWDDGERYLNRLQDYVLACANFASDSVQSELEITELVEAAKTPRMKRKKDYPPLEDLVVAMWENLIEKRSKKDSGVELLQKLRKSIKAKYPIEEKHASSKDEEETN